MTIDRALSDDEVKHSRIRLGAEFMKGSGPEKHDFVVIRKNKE